MKSITMKSVFTLALLGVSAQAESTNSFCCTALAENGLKERLSYPGDEGFHQQVNSYYSEKARLAPHCIIQPYTAAEVSLAVKTLVKANKSHPCKFAVRGNGHTTSPGSAGIEDGVTIDLGLMNTTTYNLNNSTASILPGATWGSVYNALAPWNVMVAGGRSFSVGVSGLVLGGGNSFYSPQIGLVCDGVVQFEVVLASGDIIYANKDTNADLLQVLKGGTSNFGIVTRLDLAAFPASDLWGGLVRYPSDVAPELFEAFVNWPARLREDPHATVIIFCTYSSLKDTTVFTNSYEYTKPIPRPAVFDDFMALPGNLSDTTRIADMSSLAYELEQPTHYRIRYYTLTFANDIRMLHETNEVFHASVEKFKARVSGGYEVHYLFQPLPALYAERGVQNGGNILGLDRTSEDLILCLFYISWTGAEHDDLFEGQGMAMVDHLHEYAASIGAEHEYIYLDYADELQDPLGSYGRENVEKMRAAAAKYDPAGVFQEMVPGGFKISKVAKYRDYEVKDEL
ncbi:hypothetical protein BDV18DRAFT_164251 [Aspergillus unguis]